MNCRFKINFFHNARIVKYLSLSVPSILVVCLLLLTENTTQTTKPVKNNLPTVEKRELGDVVLQQSAFIYPSNRKILCVSFKGRLGNLMFQYASAYGIAKWNNLTLRVSIHDRIPQIFNISVQKVSNKIYCKYAYNKFENKHCAYDPEMLNITRKLTKVNDYLQSWKYFQQYEKDVRQEFKFNKTISNYAANIFIKATEKTKYFRKNATYVGVHIRRGDMFYAQIKNKTQVSGYNVAPRSYIEKALKYFKKRYKRATFIFCSDDIRWAMWQYGRYQRLLNIAFIHQSPEVDLAVLGMCNHTIMTTGTFGWWGAWLAGGETVYYKHYVKNDSLLRKHFSEDFSDYYLPGWKAME